MPDTINPITDQDLVLIDTYKVYVKLDPDNKVIAINSSAFIPEDDLANWVQIDEGTGDKYHHAQGNYFTDVPLYNEYGISNHKYDGTSVILRTEEEIQADIAAIPPPPPSQSDQIAQLQSTLNALLGG